MHFSSLFIASSIPLLAQAAPLNQDAWGSYQMVDLVKSLHSEWTYQGPASNNTVLNLQLVIKANNGNDLETKLLEISTPGAADYGKHMSQHELREFVEPGEGRVEDITSWLSSFSAVGNITHLPHSSTISFQSTVSTANSMLQADFSIYKSIGGGSIVRSRQYSLPSTLTKKIAFVHPVTYFPSTKPIVNGARKTVDDPADSLAPRDIYDFCATITPACIAALYNITYTPPVNSSSDSALGVVGFLEQYINHTDVTSFVRKYGNSPSTRANPGTFSVELVNGGVNNETGWGIEATLDMEYSMPFVGSLPVTYYSVGGRPPKLGSDGQLVPEDQVLNEPYLEFLQYMLAKPDGSIPQVLSMSYTDTEQSVPYDYAVHVCELFGRLAARGVSIIAASGDGGVQGVNDADCVSNDGKNHTQFLPTFPASCPYITAVGATHSIPEEGASFSSGGFSNYFPTPDYQAAAAASYISYLDGQYEGLYNRTGRGIPDVALYGSRYETENNNVTSGHHSGTSASTPVFASIITLLNDLRLADGKPALGWLNPLLYSKQLESAFNDITEGVSYGCEKSWNATTGWDTVTGLGTVDFERLMGVLT